MNQKRKYGWIKHLDFVIVDLICIQAAYLLSYWYRHHNFFMYLRTDLYTHINILIIVLDLCYVMFHMAYKNILKRSVWKELESVIVQNVVIWVIAMAYLYVSKQAFWFEYHTDDDRKGIMEDCCPPETEFRKDTFLYSCHHDPGTCP